MVLWGCWISFSNIRLWVIDFWKFTYNYILHWTNYEIFWMFFLHGFCTLVFNNSLIIPLIHQNESTGLCFTWFALSVDLMCIIFVRLCVLIQNSKQVIYLLGCTTFAPRSTLEGTVEPWHTQHTQISKLIETPKLSSVVSFKAANVAFCWFFG